MKKNALLCLSLLAAFLVSLTAIHSDDLFMYLALGRRFFTLGEFGEIDPFLFTFKDYHWYVVHEWLSYLVYYALYLAGGYRLLIVFRAGLVALAAAFVWRAGSRNKLSALPLLIVSALAFYFASGRSFADRCSFFSDLFTVGLLLFLTNESMRFKVRRVHWLLPVLFLLWIQLHPGFLIAWFILGLFALTHFKFWTPDEKKKWAFLLFACVAITIINPIGIYGILIPIQKFMSPEWQIYRSINSEWMSTLPSYFLSIPYKIFVTIFSIVTIAATFKTSHKAGWFPLLAAFLLTYLGLSAVRFLALAGFGLGVLFCSAIARMELNWGEFKTKQVNAIAYLIPVVVIAASLFAPKFGPHVLIPQYPLADAVPLKAVRLLKVLPPGNIFNEFDFGGFLAWELDGRMKIAAHGHIDSPSLVIQNYYRFTDSRKNWDEIITQNNVEYFLVHTKSLVENPNTAWVKELSENWDLKYQDEAAAIFIKKGPK